MVYFIDLHYAGVPGETIQKSNHARNSNFRRFGQLCLYQDFCKYIPFRFVVYDHIVLDSYCTYRGHCQIFLTLLTLLLPNSDNLTDITHMLSIVL